MVVSAIIPTISSERPALFDAVKLKAVISFTVLKGLSGLQLKNRTIQNPTSIERFNIFNVT